MSQIPKPYRLEMHHQLNQNCSQGLILTLAMRQALHVLQLPAIELRGWLEEQIQSNPLLEYREHIGKGVITDEEDWKTLYFNQLIAKPSLEHHLAAQVREHFESKYDQDLATTILSHLNDKGYLITPLNTLANNLNKPLIQIEKIVETIKTFDPKGIAANSIQECLLLQIPTLSSHYLAKQILSQHYNTLLSGNLRKLEKATHSSGTAIREALDQIKLLKIHPFDGWQDHPNPAITPDLSITCDDQIWTATVLDSLLPSFSIQSCYLDAPLSKEDRSYIKKCATSGIWLFRVLERRRATLQKLGDMLIEKQKPYFTGDSSHPLPLTYKTLATELSLHESTITRAVQNKYMICPRGLIPIRSLFCTAAKCNEIKKTSPISTTHVRNLLKQLIAMEDKSHPLTDEKLSAAISSQGIVCARRTIVKYRTQLRIPPASKRRFH